MRASDYDRDEQIGVDIVKRACEEPIRQIVVNSGTEGAIVVGKVREAKDANFGGPCGAAQRYCTAAR